MASSLRTVCANLNKVARKQIFLKACVPSLTQNANLVSVNSAFALPVRTKKYNKKTMNPLDEVLDFPFLRFDDNSRVISVEGNIGSGKHEFAKKIAKEFDMLYVPDVDFNKIWQIGNAFDRHKMNKALGQNVHMNLEDIFMNENLKKEKYLAEAQLQMLRCRLASYCDGQSNLFKTGQGMVVVRSPFSDNLFPQLLRDMNAMSKRAFDYYMYFYTEVWETAWRPHMIIHLDASVDYCMDRIKKRNKPYEVNSPILTRDFLERWDFHFENDYLANIRRNLELVTYDPVDLGDWDLLVEELESYDLLEEEFLDERGIKFFNWNKNHKRTWTDYMEFTMEKEKQDDLFRLEDDLEHINMPTFEQCIAQNEIVDPEDPELEQIADLEPVYVRKEAAV